MRVTVLCTDQLHPVIPYVLEWQQKMQGEGHQVLIASDKAEISDGDFLFLISCSQVITKAERKKFKFSLVLHASDLPRGRGWSPHIWTLLKGERDITVSLLEANDPVDSGDVWLKKTTTIKDHMLLPEINHELFTIELSLMAQAVNDMSEIKPMSQDETKKTYWPKRTPEDSRLDPNKKLTEQFNTLRLSDPVRHPAFMDYLGHRYLVKIEKINSNEK